MKSSVVLVLFFVCFVFGQFDTQIIDTFVSGDNSVVILSQSNSHFPIVESNFSRPANPTGLLGGERDLIVTMSSGANKILSSEVTPSEVAAWVTGAPSAPTSGTAVMQWDGKDGSPNLSVNGLGGIDFVQGGLAKQLRLEISNDQATSYTVLVTTIGGGQCTFVQQLNAATVLPPPIVNYTILFTQFSGNCDFTKVGAVQITIDALPDVDTSLYSFAVNGPNVATTTQTPTRSPVFPSVSGAPSPSRIPNPSGTPSPPPSNGKCVCVCPVFTCGLIFAQPVDDDGANDDEDLIYRPVYYAAANGAFNNVAGNDDDDNLDLIGGLTASGHANDDIDKASNAPFGSSGNSLFVSVFMMIGGILVAMI